MRKQSSRSEGENGFPYQNHYQIIHGKYVNKIKICRRKIPVWWTTGATILQGPECIIFNFQFMSPQRKLLKYIFNFIKYTESKITLHLNITKFCDYTKRVCDIQRQ